MREKIKQYRPVWGPLLVAVFLAELLLLVAYHVPGIESVLGAVALDYSGSQDGKLAEYGEIKQIGKIDGKMVVTFGRTDGSPEFGAVVFERGWNGLWAPVAANGGRGAPVQRIDLNEQFGMAAVYAVACPEEAAFWRFVDISALVGETMTDTATARPVEGPAFIEFLEDSPNMRIALYDAQGKELPPEQTRYDGPSGGWGKGTVELELLNQIAGAFLLVGVAVAAVRLRRLRRQGRAAQEVAEL